MLHGSGLVVHEGGGAWDCGGMTGVLDSAVYVMDAVLRHVCEAEETLRAARATTGRIIGETDWQARAASAYRRAAGTLRDDLGATVGELVEHEHDLRAMCAAVRAAGGG